jgi:hypothetical protein
VLRGCQCTRTKDLVQAVKGALGEDDKAAEVAARCQLQQVQGVNARDLHACVRTDRQKVGRRGLAGCASSRITQRACSRCAESQQASYSRQQQLEVVVTRHAPGRLRKALLMPWSAPYTTSGPLRST